MPNNRTKGLIFCREVKKILEGIGHQVEGPGYTTAFFGGKTNAIHRDYFSIFDLISFFEGGYFFHQVSDLGHKSEKIKAIQAKGMPGWVWSRVSNGRVFYRVFIIKSSGEIEEAEIRWR
jgi:hypothetical protein